MSESLDLSKKNVEEAQTTLDGLFEGLADNRNIELIADFDLRALLPALQEKNWGKFNWFPLEDGPSIWRVDLTLLNPAVSPRGIEELFTSDHQRCDEIFVLVEAAAQAGDLDKAKKNFAEFILGMNHHFAMEEEGFFPAFEQATGMTQGPTMVMKMEHTQMRGLLMQMQEAVNKEDVGEISQITSTLMVIMRQHNIKEEQMLYRMGGMHLSNQADTILRTVQAL
ncbi:MAG: hemerythrin domain-containing protein [Magnetococcales bacterium]|nr:hemerythrin domain-containing protein [Magnetococcales bacterium]